MPEFPALFFTFEEEKILNKGVKCHTTYRGYYIERGEQERDQTKANYLKKKLDYIEVNETRKVRNRE